MARFRHSRRDLASPTHNEPCQQGLPRGTECVRHLGPVSALFPPAAGSFRQSRSSHTAWCGPACSCSLGSQSAARCRALRATLADRSVVWRLAVSATLISINWLIYVWGVTHGHVIETSLGYFIGPLVNVVLGVGLLSEKLSPAQWVAVALAVAGVSYLTVMTGSLPWIALTLAFSFATYGLIRKVVKVESLPGLATETLLLAPFAAAYLLWCESAGIGALGHAATRGQRASDRQRPSSPPSPCFCSPTGLAASLLDGRGLQYITPTLQFIAACSCCMSLSSARAPWVSRSSGRRSLSTPAKACGCRASSAHPLELALPLPSFR